MGLVSADANQSKRNDMIRGLAYQRPSRRHVLLAAATAVVGFITLALPTAAQPEDSVVTAAEALSLARRGELIMIDVRSPQEWRETGVPEHAQTVTIHNPDGLAGFVADVADVVGTDKERPIALICARGNRSSVGVQALRQAGFRRILNVREGLFGNGRDGPGWLGRGLPTGPCRRC